MLIFFLLLLVLLVSYLRINCQIPGHEDLFLHFLQRKKHFLHLEPDILESEVKWALGSITMNKASGSGGIPFALFHILKDDAIQVHHKA